MCCTNRVPFLIEIVAYRQFSIGYPERSCTRNVPMVQFVARVHMGLRTRSGPGRPPKFGRPSRAVTLTLPNDVLERLSALNSDLGRAVVALVERRPAARPKRERAAQLSSYGKHAVIVVRPVRALERLAGVQLVPLGNGRALVSLAPTRSIPELELGLRDAIERATGSDRATLEQFAGILRDARLSPGVTLEARTIIVLESKRQRRRAPARTGARGAKNTRRPGPAQR